MEAPQAFDLGACVCSASEACVTCKSSRARMIVMCGIAWAFATLPLAALSEIRVAKSRFVVAMDSTPTGTGNISASFHGVDISTTVDSTLTGTGNISASPHGMDNSTTVLLGAIGRHNFGDMLMAHVAEVLLREHCSIGKGLVFADLLGKDMRVFGGHNVQSIASFQNHSERLNIVVLGGEVIGCPVDFAVAMLVNSKSAVARQMDELEMASPHWLRFKEKVRFAYLPPKSLFNNPGTFVANTIGGMEHAVDVVLNEYDYCSVRNPVGNMTWKHLAPDSVVMLRSLFAKRIASRASNLSLGTPYIAVQLRPLGDEMLKTIARELAKAAAQLSAQVVIFRAGAAFGHDSLGYLFSLAQQILAVDSSLDVQVFEGLNIWDICAVISNALIMFSTSLHCRIVAVSYSVPRITYAEGLNTPKQKSFVQLWDANVHNISLSNGTDLFQTISAAMRVDNLARFRNETAAKEMSSLYMSTFWSWARKLPGCQQDGHGLENL